MPAEFQWLRPEWLLALPLVAIMAYLLARRQLAPGSWQRVVDPALAPHVLLRSEARGLSYRWWLMLLGGVIAALSLAGPSWNRIEQPVFRSEQAIVIAADLSRSMDAQDINPSRLARAKLKVLDILKRRTSGQTALVVYSSHAFTVTPLTTDADTVAALVNSLSTDIMPSRGSYPVAAITKGRQLLEQAGVGYGEVLLITDGASSPTAERAAEELRETGYTLSVMGVGTTEGAPIPRAGGGFVTDRSGNIAVPRLEEDGLKRLASVGGGRYTPLTADDRDIDRLLSGEIGPSSESDRRLSTDQWQEEGPWLLLLLVPLAAMAFRRGWILAVAILVMPVPETAFAFGWDDLWTTKDQQASKLMENGNAAQAADLFEDPVWRAVANYQAGEFPDSVAGFADRDDADNVYNLGNALARSGELAAAIEAYNRALEVEPDMEDAVYNRDLVRELLEQQESQSGEESGQDSNSEEGGGAQQSEGAGQSEQQAQAGATGNPEGEPQDGDPSARSEDEMNQEDLEAMQRELERAAQEAEQQETGEQESISQAEAIARRREQEQRQAMEQWLRRIPDDPGGLLRRKFQYQYQRQGRDQDGNNLWPDDEVRPW